MAIQHIKELNLMEIQNFLDYLLNKKKFLKLKNLLENDISITNIKNFIDYTKNKIYKKNILNKLQLENIRKINVYLVGHDCYPIIQFNFYYNYNTKKNDFSLNEDNVHIKLLDYYHNKKYLRFNYPVFKQLKNSLNNKNSSWNKIVVNGIIRCFRYTPQILLVGC